MTPDGLRASGERFRKKALARVGAGAFVRSDLRHPGSGAQVLLRMPLLML